MRAGLVRFTLRRAALGLLTLWLLSLVVFAGGQVLPGDVGRAILGPLADARAVAALNHQLGVDRPAPVLYLTWIGGMARGDMGESLTYRQPVAALLGGALVNSLKLAGLILVLVVPLGISAGVFAALRAGRWQDRLVTVGGLSLSVIPEFVSAIVLILVFGVWLRWLPLSASWPAGSGFPVQLQHLLLPALPLVLVLFGYIARLARAGTIGALEADYTRTAVLKGLPRRVVITRHVLRNAMLPVVTTIGLQIGALLAGAVLTEKVFSFPGIGDALARSFEMRDYAMLQLLIMGAAAVYVLVNLIVDLLYAVIDPRVRTAR